MHGVPKFLGQNDTIYSKTQNKTIFKSDKNLKTPSFSSNNDLKNLMLFVFNKIFKMQVLNATWIFY